jgi:hypothetical protein
LEGLRVKEKEKKEREGTGKDRRKKIDSGEEWISPVLEIRICAALKWDSEGREIAWGYEF